MILRKKNEQECFLCFLYEGNLLCQILIAESHCVFLYALHTGADLKFFYGVEFQYSESICHSKGGELRIMGVCLKGMFCYENANNFNVKRSKAA